MKNVIFCAVLVTSNYDRIMQYLKKLVKFWFVECNCWCCKFPDNTNNREIAQKSLLYLKFYWKWEGFKLWNIQATSFFNFSEICISTKSKCYTAFSLKFDRSLFCLMEKWRKSILLFFKILNIKTPLFLVFICIRKKEKKKLCTISPWSTSPILKTLRMKEPIALLMECISEENIFGSQDIKYWHLCFHGAMSRVLCCWRHILLWSQVL